MKPSHDKALFWLVVVVLLACAAWVFVVAGDDSTVIPLSVLFN